MKKNQLINRIIYLPVGLIKALLYFSNIKSRDIENKTRFKKVTIETGCSFSVDTTIKAFSTIQEYSILNNCHIGSYTYIGRNSLLQNVKIGNYCSISHEVMIGLGSHPLTEFSTSPLFYRVKSPLKIKLIEEDTKFKEYKKISIGSDVWIGAKAIILDGVTIGNGSVIAAGAIVTKDVPPYAIVGGIPAVLIRFRFKENIRNKLLQTLWWEKEAEQVLKEKQFLEAICLEAT